MLPLLQGRNMKTIKAIEYGIKPNTDCSQKIREMISSLSDSKEEITIVLEKGQYDFFAKKAPSAFLRVTNSCGKKEWDKDDVENLCNVGMLIENAKNLTVDGNGSVFVLHGKFTNIAIRNCENIEIKNLTVRADNPDMHELKVIKRGLGYVDFELDRESLYVKENNKFYFVGEGHRRCFTDDRLWAGWIGKIDGSNLNNLKRVNHPLKTAISFKELKKNIFRARMLSCGFKPNDRFYIFDVIRKNHGVFIEKSKNITIKDYEQNFNYGLAVVAQDSENIRILDSRFCPNAESSKLMASVADFVQICMCRGDIEIVGNYFEGSGDDALNVHGVHYKVVEAQDNKIKIKYCHHQTSGFCPFREGDIVKVVNVNSLVEKSRTTVKSAKLLDEFTIELQLNDSMDCVGDVIENLSACPNLIYKNNIINRIITRGLLITTSGKVLVENNEFRSTSMNAIVVSDDAKLWYESGNVEDIEIKNNKFLRCLGYTVYIKPENTVYEGAVHKNIRIIHNTIDSKGQGGFFVKDSDDVIIANNKLLSKTRKTVIKRSKVTFENNK